MNNLKVWPHLTVVALVFAALGVGAAALWTRHEPTAEALALPSAARVERVDGEVALSRGLSADGSDEGWIEVTPNTPITTGDRLYALEDSRAGLAFTGRNFARLDPGSSLDVVSLTDRRTQLALRDGSAIFNIGQLRPGEVFEIATPHGAVDFREPGLYQMGYNDDGSAFVSVLSGLAQVVGLAGSGQVSKGEMLTLLGQTAAQIALSRLSPSYAGGLLNDYYGYQYPDAYDGRYGDYNAYLNDPSYYDPYRSYQSYRYVPVSVPGAYDLDRYGDWRSLDDYGYAWSPRVADAGWAPYRDGYWVMDDPYGLTWVSNEPWGYAPYHYGRWVTAGDRWYWVPDGAATQPAYAPALVAFLPPAQDNFVGWVPLAPGDPYSTAYYDANWQPHYYGGEQPVFQQQAVNFGVPGAVTVVPVADFGGVIDPRSVARFDRRAADGTRAVHDPLSVALLRQAALQITNTRRRVGLPPGLAKRLDGTRVFTSARPFAPPFQEDPSRLARVEAVPEERKREKLQFKDERQSADVRQPPAGRGGGEGRRLARELRRQEQTRERAARREDSARAQQLTRAQAESERAARRAGQQRAEGERVGLLRQQAQRAEGRQRAAAAEQQRAVMRQQGEARRQAQQQQAAAQQRAQHEAARQAQRQQEMRAHQQRERSRPQQQPRAQQQPRPQPAAQAAPGQMRKQQQAPAQPHGGGHPGGGPPQGAKPHGGKKGKGD